MLKALFAAGFLILALLLPSVGDGQSLADVARAEEARRKASRQPSKVYTNDDLAASRGAPAVDVTPPMPVAAPASAPASTAAKPAPAPGPQTAASEAPKDEKYWRERLGAARAAVERSQAFLDALQSQINGLYTEFVNMSDPIQRAAIEKKRLLAIGEQERLKSEITQQIKAVAAIEDEARRASVPPGWLR
jgi:hypothetical protein